MPTTSSSQNVRVNGPVLKARMNYCGYTQAGLAERSGYSKNAIGNWVAERHPTSVNTLMDLAQVLNCSYLALIHPDEDRIERTELEKALIGFTLFRTQRIYNFAGRAFVFEKVQAFLDENSSGYFLIHGKPGIGKSSIISKLVEDHGYVHHFNNELSGITGVEAFLRNIAAQIILRYQLPHETIPQAASQDSRYLEQIFTEAAERRQEKLVIVIDALDEAAPAEGKANVLNLPQQLPDGVFVVATAREEKDPRRRLEVAPQTPFYAMEIESGSDENMADVEAYIRLFLRASLDPTERPHSRLRDFMTSNKMGEAEFVRKLAQLSQGNFMYLVYMLPDLEKGIYSDLAISELPRGLEQYYERHWARMKGMADHDPEARGDWDDNKVPVLACLAIQSTAVSPFVISDQTKLAIDDPEEKVRKITGILAEWAQFLDMEAEEVSINVDMGDEIVPITVPYRKVQIYHETFKSFLKRHDIIATHLLLRASSDAADALRKGEPREVADELER